MSANEQQGNIAESWELFVYVGCNNVLSGI